MYKYTVSMYVFTCLFQLDGVLFYNKKTFYTFGTTPLVLWLKAYMMPEILGVPVPDDQMSQRPQDYTGFTQHVKSVREQAEAKPKRQYIINPSKLNVSKDDQMDSSNTNAVTMETECKGAT